MILKIQKQTTLQCTYNNIKIKDSLLTGIDRRRIPSAGFMIASWRTVATLPATPEVEKRRKMYITISSHKMLKNRTETHLLYLQGPIQQTKGHSTFHSLSSKQQHNGRTTNLNLTKYIVLISCSSVQSSEIRNLAMDIRAE